MITWTTDWSPKRSKKWNLYGNARSPWITNPSSRSIIHIPRDLHPTNSTTTHIYTTNRQKPQPPQPYVSPFSPIPHPLQPVVFPKRDPWWVKVYTETSDDAQMVVGLNTPHLFNFEILTCILWFLSFFKNAQFLLSLLACYSPFSRLSSSPKPQFPPQPIPPTLPTVFSSLALDDYTMYNWRETAVHASLPLLPPSLLQVSYLFCASSHLFLHYPTLFRINNVIASIFWNLESTCFLLKRSQLNQKKIVYKSCLIKVVCSELQPWHF